MNESKIDQFFTPVSRSVKPAVKRTRPSSTSPGTVHDAVTDMVGGDETLGNLTRGQLLDDISALLDSKLSNLVSNLASKDDVTNLSDQVSSLAEENKNLKEEIEALRAQERAVINKLVDLESRSRRNNLIFKGLRWSKNTKDFREVVDKFCREVMGAEGNLWINRAHLLGKKGSAIIAHFPSDSEIDYLMSRVSRLKGTGYVVHRDYPAEVRLKRARLMEVRKEVERVAGKIKMPLVFDHLEVQGCRFTWDEGRLRAGQEDGADKLQSLFDRDFRNFLANLGKRKRERRGSTRASESDSDRGVMAAELVATSKSSTSTEDATVVEMTSATEAAATSKAPTAAEVVARGTAGRAKAKV